MTTRTKRRLAMAYTVATMPLYLFGYAFAFVAVPLLAGAEDAIQALDRLRR